jgi:HSP20 family protein
MSDIKLERVSDDTRAPQAFAEAERLLERIRARAFELAGLRGFGAGRALDDWLAAERELSAPATELIERPDEYELSVALPGFEPGDVSLSATPRALVVQAKRRSERRDEAKRGEAVVHWSALETADVCRRVEFERELDMDKVTATLKNGVLKVVARKAKAAAAKPAAVAAAA